MNDICAIVVSYNPDPGFFARVEVLQEQVDRVVIVDNGSCSGCKVQFDGLAALSKVRLISNCVNRGIATALNQGVDHALQGGFRWVATFDQDSTVRKDFFKSLLEVYEAFPQREKVAVLAPLLHDAAVAVMHSFTYGRPPDHPLYSVVRTSVTSGNLIPVRVFEFVGRYREDFFIDYVDHEFCLRCRRLGWLIVESRRAILDHRYGDPTRRRFLWKRPTVRNHSALRRYYQARNRLVVYRQIGFFDLCWEGRDMSEFMRDTVKIILLEDNKCAKLHAIVRGIWHGLLNKLGPAAFD